MFPPMRYRAETAGRSGRCRSHKPEFTVRLVKIAEPASNKYGVFFNRASHRIVAKSERHIADFTAFIQQTPTSGYAITRKVLSFLITSAGKPRG